MTPPPATAPSPRRLVLLLALASLTLVGLLAAYPGVMGAIGIGTGDLWFRDLLAVLSAIDAKRHGIDPSGSAAAFLQHNYSGWWFWLEFTHVGPRDTAWLGCTLVGLTLVTTWLIAQPRRGADVVWSLLVLASPAVVLGLNRANVDLGFFVLLSLCVPAVLAKTRFWRIAGAVAVIALGTGLKYYPIFAAPILLAIRPGKDRRLAGWLALAGFGLAILSVLPDLLRFRGVVEVEGFYVFGATAAFRKLGFSGASAPLLAAFGLLLAGLALARRTPLRDWRPSAAEPAIYLHFIVGAAVLSGCFVFAVNYAYRWVFALLMMPFLCRPEPAAPAARTLKSATRVLLLLQLWLEAFPVLWLNYHPQTFLGLQQWTDRCTTALTGVTWLLFACLAGWLVHFAGSFWPADHVPVARGSETG